MDSYVDTWKKVMTSPSEFYESMPKEGGYGEPLKFAVVNLIVNAIGTAIIGLYMGSMVIDWMSQMYDVEIPAAAAQATAVGMVSGIISNVIFGIIGLFIVGVILFILFKIVGGSGSYEGTVRLYSYSTAVALLSWIPLLGLLLMLYQIYLNIIGGKHVHNISTARSAIAVLLPIVVMLLLIAAFAAAIIAAISMAAM